MDNKANKIEKNIGDLLGGYLSYRKLHVRGSSLSQIKTAFHKYYASFLSLTPKEAFRLRRMERNYDSIIDKEITSEWKNRLFGVMRRFAYYCYSRKLIGQSAYTEVLSVYENIPEGRSGFKEKEIWRKEEEERFLHVIDNKKDYAMFSLFIELGARIGEFLGLRWLDIDLDKGRVYINHQLLNASQKTYVLSDKLKTKESYRTCLLRKKVIDILKDYKNSRNPLPSDFLFSSFANPSIPYSKEAFRKKLDRYIRVAGVRRVTPHSIRHMKASRLLKACKNMMEMKAAARFMGHSASIFINVYSHSEEATLEALLKRLD